MQDLKAPTSLVRNSIHLVQISGRLTCSVLLIVFSGDQAPLLLPPALTPAMFLLYFKLSSGTHNQAECSDTILPVHPSFLNPISSHSHDNKVSKTKGALPPLLPTAHVYNRSKHPSTSNTRTINVL